MSKSKLVKKLLSLLLILIVMFASIPFTTVAAKHGQNSHNNHDDNKYQDSTQKTKYLVLVGQTNGTYIAYDDIAFATANTYVMVKAKPIASALGLTYTSNLGYWYKKGCSLSLDNHTNVYIKNKKTYYFMDYNYATGWTTTTNCTAQYKHIIYQNYNAIHSASLSTLVNYQYYSTYGQTAYSSLGYNGVVVYNRYSAITKLPDLTNVSNLNNGNQNNNQNNDPYSSFTKVTINPVTNIDSYYYNVKHVDATYTTLQSTNSQLLDLTKVLNAYTSYSLASNGIYGYGNCDKVITLRGIDKNGNTVGEIKTTGSEFLVNFPNAVKLGIIGEQKNLIIDFMPVLPLVITSTTKLSLSQINWLFPSDGYARQYFVVAENIRFSTENILSNCSLTRKIIDATNISNNNWDYLSAYQRITAVFAPTSELKNLNSYINFQKTSKSINNSLVEFKDTGNAVLATDYESKLNIMIGSLISLGSNIYYPQKNFNRKLVMKVSSETINTTYNYINVDSSYLNLDYIMDYYYQLHEMAHYYEATQMHYGFRFQTWTDGNAINLTKNVLNAMGINNGNTRGSDFIDNLYATNYSFLTQYDKDNFEAYYLNATGWNASIIGYHFTDFLQDTYGSNILYKIMQKIYASNIPISPTRNSTYDKQFTDCIKSVTSPEVFQLFIKYCVK